MRQFLAFAALLAATSAAAQTCKYVDQEGRIIYSNIPIKNARKVTCFEAPRAPAGEAQAPKPGNGASAPPPAARVDSNIQRGRDEQRRRILENELAAEEERLAEAQRALAEQESIRLGDERNYARVLERLKPYQEAVAQHQKNVASIKQELANLR